MKKFLKWVGYGFLALFVLAFFFGEPEKASEPEVEKPAQAVKETYDPKLEFIDFLYNAQSSTPKSYAELYLESKGDTTTSPKQLYACATQKLLERDFTNKTGKLSELFDQCLALEKSDPKKFESKIDCTPVLEFLTFEHEHVSASRVIKTLMNDPKSYQFVDAHYKVVKDGDKPYVIGLFTFRGKNGFGAYVKQTIRMRRDVAGGEWRPMANN